eukprot:gene15342-biopygen3230
MRCDAERGNAWLKGRGSFAILGPLERLECCPVHRRQFSTPQPQPTPHPSAWPRVLAVVTVSSTDSQTRARIASLPSYLGPELCRSEHRHLQDVATPVASLRVRTHGSQRPFPHRYGYGIDGQGLSRVLIRWGGGERAAAPRQLPVPTPPTSRAGWSPAALVDHQPRWLVTSRAGWSPAALVGHQPRWLITSPAGWSPSSAGWSTGSAGWSPAALVGHQPRWLVTSPADWSPAALVGHQSHWLVTSRAG